ncbi:hypothetical protein METUNv1_02562 [Methyloversatilis universalis FAM5]|uniref:Uncharacterized protein n=1 Tax=Methyloversatilis universalis (strain ATCC BAA-1314 / DSM 25237 / JCM 13912 / CCUG 52030 / FAM5) TaxID=1000565 RepID=F5RE44_METUF|nr:hypothetical protein METUNv1_02562 [Methyloversatilis universalis FAM5]
MNRIRAAVLAERDEWRTVPRMRGDEPSSPAFSSRLLIRSPHARG